MRFDVLLKILYGGLLGTASNEMPSFPLVRWWGKIEVFVHGMFTRKGCTESTLAEVIWLPSTRRKPMVTM